MRIVRYQAGDRIGCGVWVDGRVYDTGLPGALDLIRAGDAGLDQARRATQGTPVAVDRLLAPLVDPGKIFGLGRQLSQPWRRRARIRVPRRDRV